MLSSTSISTSTSTFLTLLTLIHQTTSSILPNPFPPKTQQGNKYGTVPSVSVPTYCTPGFSPGSDTVILDIPHSYSSVLSIISDFGNLTWSGNPPDTITLNGTNNFPGTARWYSLQGLDVVETLMKYNRPAVPSVCTNSPSQGVIAGWENEVLVDQCVYREVHSTAQFTFEVPVPSSSSSSKEEGGSSGSSSSSQDASSSSSNQNQPPNSHSSSTHSSQQRSTLNLTLYMPTDGELAYPLCGGKATRLNLTATFCTNNVPVTQALLHALHLADAEVVNEFLGGGNFTGCGQGILSSSSGSGGLEGGLGSLFGGQDSGSDQGSDQGSENGNDDTGDAMQEAAQAVQGALDGLGEELGSLMGLSRRRRRSVWSR